jgi:hypothetical protein
MTLMSISANQHSDSASFEFQADIFLAQSLAGISVSPSGSRYAAAQ